jgi:hypothetical protein
MALTRERSIGDRKKDRFPVEWALYNEEEEEGELEPDELEDARSEE